MTLNVEFRKAHINWDNLNFDFEPTDYMYFMKCDEGGTFSKVELKHFGNIELNPSAGFFYYGQVIPFNNAFMLSHILDLM
jgi:branched-chain amino acid aminotransferase